MVPSPPGLPAPRFLLPALAALLTPALSAQQASFTDRTVPSGLVLTHTLDPVYAFDPMRLRAGGAVADFDRDGWPDVFLLGGGGIPDALFINQGDGTFVDEAASWGVDRMHHGVGACAGDYDGDGWIDLFIVSYGPAGQPETTGAHLLYHNEGNRSFTETAAAAGVNRTNPSAVSGSSPVFGDYDLDGDLDLYVTANSLGAGNYLFQNQGDGTFVDVTDTAEADESGVNGFVPTFADMDGDLWPELIVAADFGTNRYYINDGDGTFSRPAADPDRFTQINGMGLAIGDYDGDGLLDFTITGVYSGPGTGDGLFLNLGAHQYLENALAAGVDNGAWGWGTASLDCDNDGWIDIYETNGWPGTYEFENDRLFLNNGDGTFTEGAYAAGIDHVAMGRTILRLDYDRDGDEDLVLLSNQEPAALYRNENPGGSPGLRVLLDTSRNPGLAPDGFQTRVEAVVGSRTLVRYLDGGSSYLGTHEPALHFGLGHHGQAEMLTVYWNDGSLNHLGPVPGGVELTIQAGPPFEAPESIARGQQGELRVSKLRSGDRVAFLASTAGTGLGPDFGQGPKAALNLLRPLRHLGTLRADAQGVATLTLDVPSTWPTGPLYVQAVVLEKDRPERTGVRAVEVLP